MSALARNGDDRPAGTEARRGPGRPRDHSRTRTILDTATEIVTEVGFERLRVQDVAERAGVSLATIYRRWPTKTALVADAIRHDPGPLTELRGDGRPATVEEVLLAIATQLREARGARMAVLAVQMDEPEILRAVRETQVPPVRALVREALGLIEGQGRAEGLDGADLELLADVGPALVWYRALVAGEDDDPAELARRIQRLLHR